MNSTAVDEIHAGRSLAWNSARWLLSSAYWNSGRCPACGTDPLGGDITNPQSLNRYAYALNNPETLTDPLGLDSCTTGVDSNGNPVVNCPSTSVTVNGGSPGDLTYETSGSCGPDGLYCLGDILYVNSYGFLGNGGGGGVGGGGGLTPPPPAPKPSSGPLPSYGQVLKSFNQCAANFADKYSAASLLHVTNVPLLGALLSSSSATASHLLFGTHPSEYVPAGANLAAGVKAGWILAKGAGEAGDVPVDEGFQSIFTTIAPTRFSETVIGQALTGSLENVGAALDKFLPLQVAYDEALYGAGEAACTTQALGW